MEILAYMALGGGDALGQVLTYEGGGEAGPSSKLAGVDDLCPGGDNGAKTGAVQINDQIHESFNFVDAFDTHLRKCGLDGGVGAARSMSQRTLEQLRWSATVEASFLTRWIVWAVKTQY